MPRIPGAGERPRYESGEKAWAGDYIQPPHRAEVQQVQHVVKEFVLTKQGKWYRADECILIRAPSMAS